MPAEEVEDLFEPFRRRGQERVDVSGGVGLGLSIVRAVAEAHAGTATAETPADGGLTVRVALPVSGTGQDDGKETQPAWRSSSGPEPPHAAGQR